MRLFWKLVLVLLAVGCVPLSIASWYLIETNTNELTRSIFERHLEQASSLARLVNMELSGVSTAIEGYAAQNDIAKMSDPERRDLVRYVLERHGSEVNAVSIWKDGDPAPLALASFHATGSNPTAAHESAVAGARLDPEKPVFTDAYPGENGEPCVTLIVPVHVPGKAPSHLLAAEIRLARVQEEVATTRVGAGGDAFVVDARGRILAARDPARIFAMADLSSEARASLGAGHMSGTSDFTDAAGRDLLGAFAPARTMGWTVFVVEPRAGALAPAVRMRTATAAIALATMLGAVLVGLFFADGIARNIRTLVAGSLSVARGKFGTRVGVVRKDEIGELAHTFNYMSQQLAIYDKDVKRLYKELERGYMETIRALANSIDAKDPYTRGHSQRVTEYAAEIAREMKLPDEEITRIQFGGILHDIGKIGIKENILGKAAQLTDEEYEYMKTHPLLGVGIVDPIEFLSGVKPIIRGHHERWDGAGYPDGLKGDDIDVGARIVHVADAWDAMITQRPYNTPMSWDQGVARLREISGSQADPKVIDAFLRVLEQRRADEMEGERWREGAASGPVPAEAPIDQRTGAGGKANVFELPKKRG